MRRSVVLLNVGVALVASVILTGCQSSSPTGQSGRPAASASQPASAAPTSGTIHANAGAPIPNNGGACNASTIPAFTPDNSRGPLPGGGATALDLQAKAKALMLVEEYPADRADFAAYALGLASPYVADQPGVICPNGDVYLQNGGDPQLLVRNVQLLNTQPNSGGPIVPGSHLFLHSAADAIGDVPCRAIIQIQLPTGWQPAQGFGNYAGVTCTANGAFRVIPPAAKGTD